MAVGDLKGDNIVIKVVSGGAVVKGQVVHIEADTFWDPVVDTDTGKFGVSIDAAAGAAEDIRVCIWGKVDVTAHLAIAKGEVVMAATTGKVAATDHGAIGENVGTTMEAFDSSGTGTIFVGLVE
jgi:hypothetical protein